MPNSLIYETQPPAYADAIKEVVESVDELPPPSYTECVAELPPLPGYEEANLFPTKNT